MFSRHQVDDGKGVNAVIYTYSCPEEAKTFCFRVMASFQMNDMPPEKTLRPTDKPCQPSVGLVCVRV
jgi:hypothetical protein